MHENIGLVCLDDVMEWALPDIRQHQCYRFMSNLPKNTCIFGEHLTLKSGLQNDFTEVFRQGGYSVIS